MTSREFTTWHNYATAAIPELHRLFDGSREASERTNQWFATLADVKPEHAKAAIDAMQRGDIKRPFHLWELPATVRQYAIDACNAELSQTRRRYYDESLVVRCPHCLDSVSGQVAIWNPWFVTDCEDEILQASGDAAVNDLFREWRLGGDGRKYRTFAAACCCDSPAAKAKRDGGKQFQFKPKRHCVATGVEALHEFLRDDSRHEFDPDEWR